MPHTVRLVQDMAAVEAVVGHTAPVEADHKLVEATDHIQVEVADHIVVAVADRIVVAAADRIVAVEVIHNPLAAAVDRSLLDRSLLDRKLHIVVVEVDRTRRQEQEGLHRRLAGHLMDVDLPAHL